MRKITIAAAVALGAAATATNAQQPQTQPDSNYALEAYVSEDAIQAMYMRDINVNEVGRTQISGGFFFNEERDLIAIAGALADIGRTDSRRRLRVAVGPRVYGAFLHEQDEDSFGVGLGGEARYLIGADGASAVVLSAFYAPDILVFGNADNITDVALRFETELRANSTIFVGYRSLEFAFPIDREVDDSVHIGFRRQF
jgi:hypothetical protein